MKKYILWFLTGIVCWIPAISQTQSGFKYQAVLRDLEGNIIVNTQVNMRMSILSGNENGSLVYSETHLVTTNSLGQINLIVGNGSGLQGNFDDILWADSPYFLKIELDKTGGTNFLVLGTSPLLSVPYAFHAQTVTHNDDADADPKNEIQDLQLTGTTLKITDNPEATAIDLSAVLGTDKDQQTLSIENDSLKIENGNGVALADILTGDFDKDSTNEIQDLQLTSNYLKITGNANATNINLSTYLDNTDSQQLSIIGDNLVISGGNTVPLADILANDLDKDPANELQNLNLAGSSLEISGGNSVDLSSLADNTDQQQLSIENDSLRIENGNAVALTDILASDLDKDATNELQNLNLTGNSLEITAGNSIDLSVYMDNTDQQNLAIVDDSLHITNGNAVALEDILAGDLDQDPANELQELSFSGTELSISNGNMVDLASLQDADADPQNEIQDLQLNGSTLTITNKTSPTEIDLSPYLGTNTDEQDLSLIGNELHLTNDPTSVDLSGLLTDVDSTNELQILSYSNDTLYLSQGNKIYIPTSGGKWDTIANNIYYNSGNVGIGTITPNSKLVVYGNGGGTDDDPIFQVKNDADQVVFAVYPKGVRIYVDSSVVVGKATGSKGGFAVGGLTSGKVDPQEYLRVTSDSVRIYIDETLSKATGSKGGFAVGGFTSGKGLTENIMDLTKENYFIGHNSGTLSTGLYNCFIGYEAGKSNLLGTSNEFIGYNAGYTNTTGINNVFIGNQSGYANDTGAYNTFLGYQAGYSNKSDYNSFLGYQAGRGNTSGQYNSFIGYNAGLSNISGAKNVFLGYESGRTNTTGSSNVIMGTNAGYNNNGSNNILIGESAGYSLIGQHNTFIGSSAGSNQTNVLYNVMIGTNAGCHINTTGFSGSFNVFMGINSGYQLASSRDNTLLGSNAGYWLENGQGNTYIGSDAGRGGNDRGGAWVQGSTASNFNVSMGYQSSRNLQGGSQNVVIGAYAGYSNVTGTGNVFLGNMAGYSETGSNKLYITNTTTNPLIYGDFGTASLTINGSLNVTSSFSLNGTRKDLNWDNAYTYRVTSASGTAPLTLTLSANALTGSITQAGTSTSGYLSYTDWNTFNSKEPALTKGNLTATSPISVSATRQVIGGSATISIANASTTATGAVQLSNSYDKTNESLATTEKALSDGLATKVTGASMSMGRIFIDSDGIIISTASDDYQLYWNSVSAAITVINDSGTPCYYWWQLQSGSTITGGSGYFDSSKASNLIAELIDNDGIEIHFGGDVSTSDGCSVWLQMRHGNLTGHYVKY